MSKLALALKRISIVLVITLGPVLSHAQPGNPGGDPDVPITGIELLIGLGGLFGVKKIYDSRKKK